jgi:hypothetical protein
MYDLNKFIGSAGADKEEGGAPVPAYVHQDFPAHVHHPDGGGVSKIVKDAKTKAEALAAGWLAAPVTPEAAPDAGAPDPIAPAKSKSKAK